MENKIQFDDISEIDKLYALEIGGVDNWHMYGDLLRYFSEWETYVLKNKWIDYFDWEVEYLKKKTI